MKRRYPTSADIYDKRDQEVSSTRRVAKQSGQFLAASGKKRIGNPPASGTTTITAQDGPVAVTSSSGREDKWSGFLEEKNERRKIKVKTKKGRGWTVK